MPATVWKAKYLSYMCYIGDEVWNIIEYYTVTNIM